MLDFERIKRAIIDNPSVVAKYLPDGIREGDEYRCANIFGGKGESFSINTKSGLWSDFATGDSGNSLIDLVALQKNIEYKRAAEIIANDLHGDFSSTVAIKTTKWQTFSDKDMLIPKKLPFDYPAILNTNKEEKKIDYIWAYKNENGDVVAFDARVDKIDAKGNIKKDVYPLRFNGSDWYSKAMPAPRLLYNLDKIAKDVNKEKTIIITEGCKTAEAAAHYFPNYISTTWQGGCKAVKLADFTPLYGRNVIIVPDADKQLNPKTGDFYSWDEQPGMKAVNLIAQTLHENGCFVRIVNTKSMGEIKSGWDVADALESGMSQADLVKFFKENIYEFVLSKDFIKDSQIIEPEIVVKQKTRDNEYDDTYFFCLGVDGKNYYFYQKQTGQVLCLPLNSFKRESLMSLAPLSWWEVKYPQKNGVDWEKAVDDLFRTQEKIGVYDKNRLRGRGAWFDNGKPILHLGSSLFVDNQILSVEEFKSNYIYEKRPPLAVKLQTILPVKDSRKLIDICRLARWEKPVYGDILAGWMFSALVCGAMPFRSHLYIIGSAGSGKSWILFNIIKVVMGKMALSVSSKTTEPGIREALHGDIMPIIFDEAEAENKQDKERLQCIFDLARQASSEGADAIYKGGSNGAGGFAYICRSAFLFASINNSMTKDADNSRTAVIRMRCPPFKKDLEKRQKDSEQFKQLESMSSRVLTQEYCRCLTTRAIQYVPRLRKAAQLISNVCASEYGSKRIGDQMGMILAGIWFLQNDKDITELDAKRLIEYCAIEKEKEESGEEMSYGHKCLSHLMLSDVLFDNKKLPLSMFVAYLAEKNDMPSLARLPTIRYFESKGVKVDKNYLYLSKNEKAIPATIFKDTEWDGQGWKDTLKRIDGVESEKARRFCQTLVSGAISVPLELIFN